ncbi:MAG TPA: YqaE/Pmp3 family membrane protein [Thermomicrobiaceae bacterium]|nr:YqaE/Pmp3 family membrane protein [Thermomicrobiaceae bacterium]
MDSAAMTGGSFITVVLLLFLAFFFPPAVAMLRGSLRQVALSLILTLLGWIPGVVYALWILAHRPALRSPAGLEEYPV